MPPQDRVNELVASYLPPFACVHINLEGEITQWESVEGTCLLEDIPGFWIEPSGGINTEEKWYDLVLEGEIPIETEAGYHVIPVAYGEPDVVAYFDIFGVSSAEPIISKGTIRTSNYDESLDKWEISAILGENGTIELVSPMEKPLLSSPDQIIVRVYPYIRNLNNKGVWGALIKLKAFKTFFPLISNQ